MYLHVLPVLLLVAAALLLPVGMLLAGSLLGPRRSGRVKQMPYESGMDPVHDTRRRFDVRFHLVAIAFLIFDVELLFLYPWAVASRHPQGVDVAVDAGWISDRGLVLGGILFFLALVIVGLASELDRQTCPPFLCWRSRFLRWRGSPR